MPTLDQLVEDGSKLLLQTVCSRLIISLVFVEVTRDDLVQLVGQRQDGRLDVGVDSLGDVPRRSSSS